MKTGDRLICKKTMSDFGLKFIKGRQYTVVYIEDESDSHPYCLINEMSNSHFFTRKGLDSWFFTNFKYGK